MKPCFVLREYSDEAQIPRERPVPYKGLPIIHPIVHMDIGAATPEELDADGGT